MVDKLNRKLTLIIGALAVAVISLLLLPFRLGMDLEGGTRLLYSIDLEEAAEARLDPNEAVAEVIEIWRKRLDPQGISGVKLRAEGSNKILVELPATLSITTKAATGVLDQEYTPGDTALRLDNLTTANDFPLNGGEISFGSMRGRYTARLGLILDGLKLDKGVEAAAAPVGTTVTLEASDPWRSLIENTGEMEILMLAKDDDLTPVSTLGDGTTAGEWKKAIDWLNANPGAKITEYNQKLAAENEGSPVGRLRFYPEALPSDATEITPVADRLLPLILEDPDVHPEWSFSGETFDNVFPTFDRLGRPAVGFDIKATQSSAFAEFTRVHGENEERMAIVINDEIVTSPSLDEPLRGGGIIEGNGTFTQESVEQLVRTLNSGSLSITPIFEDRETVGASLGAAYIAKGKISVVLGLLIVLVFTMIYYKRLGVLAAVSLVFNLVLLMGAMAMLQATLTLPGVAGIILTVGMAVDANILIYERIREEALRGRRPAQSAKDGFANALSTIVDANLTTLITAILLYNFGSGPVQGFATTLIVGILTSMFSALVLTRVLVHFALEKGVDEWKMMRLVQDTNIGFMSLARKTAVVSVILVVAGVGLFTSIGRNDKLSIDFVGGVSMQIVTAETHEAQEIRDRLAGIEAYAEEFKDAQVQPLLSSAGEGGYTKFQIEFKTPVGGQAATGEGDGTADGEESADGDGSAAYRLAVEEGLADILGPNRVTMDAADPTATEMSGKVYFETAHPKDDVAAILSDDAALADVVVMGDASSDEFSFTTSTTGSAAVLRNRIIEAFSNKADSVGRDMILSQPIPASSTVGAQVVQQLRDDAILAILLSLFAVVMYIRVRFTEYSYGFAAVIALVHDVLVTLLFLSLAIMSGAINAQISLVMIAAFLTIIGYSLNDTIVVFDRIRENLAPLKGKMSLSDIIDKSINQTLARTVLTSLTTLLTVVILFVFNVGSRNDLEGFAFAVIIGVIVGTYSSMFIASPSLLWLESRRQAKLDAEGEGESEGESKAVTAG